MIGPFAASLIPVNIAEAIIDPFWDARLSSLSSYELNFESQGRATQAPGHIRLYVLESMPSPGRLLCLLQRECHIAVDVYDRFVIRASVPASMALSVQLTVDNNKQNVIEARRGKGDCTEYSGKFEGTLLQRITIELRSITAAGPAFAAIEWTGLQHDSHLKLLQNSRPVYSKQWSGLLRSEIDPESIRPHVKLFLNETELDGLRRKVAAVPYAPVMEQLREIARQCLQASPEEHIDAFYNPIITRFSRDRFCKKQGRDLLSSARICSFVGMVDQNASLLQMGARFALSLAHCEHWHDWLQSVPDTNFEHRAFLQYRCALACIYALDWAGGVLTEAGRESLLHAIADKALPDIQKTFMKYSYIRNNNQGLFFSYGWMMSLLALSAYWPHAGEQLDYVKDRIVECMDRYILPDGGADEGVEYLTDSLSQGLLGLLAYAKRKQISVHELIPPQVARVPDYVSVMMSCTEPFGSALPISDGGRIGEGPYQETVALLAHLYQDAAMHRLLESLLPIDQQEKGGSPGRIFCLLYGPEEPTVASAIDVPEFVRLQDTGMTTSCRHTPDGPIRLHLVGGKAHPSHSHADRGSFILEAYGDSLLVDAGQASKYSDPNSHLLPKTRYHNLTVPGSIEDDPEQVKPCPAATIPEGTGNSRTLHLSINTTAAWGEQTVYCCRTIDSSDPQSFMIGDKLELPHAGPAVFRINALRPFAQRNDCWVLETEHCELLIRPLWKVRRESMKQIGTDGGHRPLWQLALEADTAVMHMLRTSLLVNKR
jgi:hypothetical protein